MQNHYNTIKNKFNNNTTKVRVLDFIYTEISNRMIERLNYIKINPQTIVDIGSGLNIDAIHLKNKYPKAFLPFN